MSTTLTLRLEDDAKRRLDDLAVATQRSRSYLAAEAIRQFVEVNEWQIAQVRAAVVEADGGDFASDDEVGAVSARWQVNAG